MAQYASSESHFVDAVGGISAIKTNNKESFFHQIGNAIYTLFQEKIYALGSLSNRYGLWSEVFNAILISLVLAYSSWMVLNNTLKLGEMMAVLSISMGMIGAIARLAFTNVQVQEARVAFDRMFEFTGLRPEKETDEDIKTSKPDRIDSISMRNISFRFAGKKSLFENLNFDLKKGKVSVLMGEVGSGKTVLVNILQKFKEWDNGEVIINENMNLKAIPSKHWRSKIGVVSQETKIFSGTLLDNIALGNFMEEAEKVVDFCRKYGFDKYFEALPQNYLTIVGEEGVNLSGGQKQLVNLARALYYNPEILLLDEPTSAMDYQTEQFVLDLIGTIKHEKIVLMVSHRISYEEFADEIIRMELGSFRERVNFI